MININKLKKSFKMQDNDDLVIYDNLDLDIKKSDFVSIIGTSGSGKTTLFNLISGLDDFNNGDILVNNKNITEMTEDEKAVFRGKNISFIFQNFNLVDNLNIEENIDLVLELNNLDRRFETTDILKKVGLESKAKSYPYNLSGGEQQRVAVARAFIGNTPILLADEPTGNLDSKNSKKVLDLINELHKETSNTILMITHDIDIAKMSDKIYKLDNFNLK